MRIALRGVALFVAATGMTAPSLAQSAPTAAPKPVSPFVLCDGRTGHVSGGLRLFRALAVMGTLGVSELGTTKDDGSKRAKGKDGAAACTTALAQEQNGERRVELVIAKTIHLLEDNDLDEALATIRTAEEAAGAYKTDTGFRRTLLPRAILLESIVLVRAKRFAEAEARAVEAVRLGAYDVALAQRARVLLALTTELGAAKREALTQVARIMPINVVSETMAMTEAGRYTEAAAANADYIDLAKASLRKFVPADFEATQSALLALAGDLDGSKQFRERAESGIAAMQSTGESAARASIIASASETLTLQSLIVDLKQGKGSDARATFRAHGPWLLTNRGLVFAAMQQLQAGAPASELTGNLGESAAAWRERKLAEFATTLATEDFVKSLYGLALASASAEEFAKAGRVTWTTGKKPKFLLPPDKKDPPPFEIMSTITMASVSGLPSGEALLLQAGLIARERGLDGVALIPVRQTIDLMGVRFGKIGTPGFPESLTFRADKLVADLTPVIPRPTPGN